MTPAEYFAVVAALAWAAREAIHQYQRRQGKGQR